MALPRGELERGGETGGEVGWLCGRFHDAECQIRVVLAGRVQRKGMLFTLRLEAGSRTLQAGLEQVTFESFAGGEDVICPHSCVCVCVLSPDPCRALISARDSEVMESQGSEAARPRQGPFLLLI